MNKLMNQRGYKVIKWFALETLSWSHGARFGNLLEALRCEVALYQGCHEWWLVVHAPLSMFRRALTYFEIPMYSPSRSWLLEARACVCFEHGQQEQQGNSSLEAEAKFGWFAQSSNVIGLSIEVEESKGEFRCTDNACERFPKVRLQLALMAPLVMRKNFLP
jgi:hypothetical protein